MTSLNKIYCFKIISLKKIILYNNHINLYIDLSINKKSLLVYTIVHLICD